MTAVIEAAELHAIIGSHPPEQRFALSILQDLQQKYNYVPREAIPLIAAHINVSAGQLYAMATFYKAISLKPKGKHIIKVCDGTACHIHSSLTLVDSVSRALGIAPGETSADGLFSLELVNCLGSCAIAPVLVVGETFYGQVTPEKLPQILDQYKGATV